jgi:hypothetical protein
MKIVKLVLLLVPAWVTVLFTISKTIDTPDRWGLCIFLIPLVLIYSAIIGEFTN